MSGQFVWDEWAQKVYLTWLAREIRYAQAVLHEVRDCAGQTPQDPLLWIQLESFLMFTAKVSKILKPVGVDTARPKKPGPRQDAYDRRKLRGERLRELLEVTDASPVLDRSVRDASEHFDERLDAWLGPQRRVTADELEAGASLLTFTAPPRRGVNPDSWVIVVAGETLDLGAIETELERLLARAMALEPLVRLENPEVATRLAELPPFPPELRLNAPTRRPHESILAGVDPQQITDCQEEFSAMIKQVTDTFRRKRQGD